MKKNTYIYLIASLFLNTQNSLYGALNERIKIVCTSALKPQNYEERKQQYIHALSLLKNKYGFDFYLVESIANSPTFLDEYCNHICYTHSNDASLVNYGINEAVSLIMAFEQLNFEPDTMIIKLTGRYPLENDEFIKIVEQNMDADVIARTWHEGDACTGLFAIRLRYFVDFLTNHIDFAKMETHNIPLEHFFGAYITKIKKEGAKIVPLKKMYDFVWTPPQYPAR